MIFDISAAVGAPCTNNDECLAPNAQCTLGVCKCPSIYDPDRKRCETSKIFINFQQYKTFVKIADSFPCLNKTIQMGGDNLF